MHSHSLFLKIRFFLLIRRRELSNFISLQKCFHQIKIPFRLNDEAYMAARNRADLCIQFPEQLCKTVLVHFCKKHRQFSNRCQPARCAKCFFSYTAAAMHQTMMALFVLLWLITDIHVATGICIACAISGTAANRRFHMTG